MRSTGLLVLVTITAAALAFPSLASLSSPDASPDRSESRPVPAPKGAPGPPLQRGERPEPARPIDLPRRELPGRLGEADGAVAYGTTVFDEGIPGVANLDPSLLRALRRAASDAAQDGIVFLVNSGWRSPEYQEHLLREAVARYGSEKEAARWVASPTVSAHVSGDAIDIGPAAAAAWLSDRGAEYGLCQIYGNEPWHYELRREVDRGCPPLYADPTEDPRMKR